MSYASQADLVTRFGSQELIELTDRTDGNAIDSAIVTTALVDADAIIDGYLVGRYAVPVTPTPALLLRVAADIARFLLYKDRPTESVRQAYEDALKILADLSKGTAALAGAAAAPLDAAPARPIGRILTSGGDKLLTRDSLADYLG
jgi:phage gp36-like protein